jgi:hypothetical protein
LSPRKVLGYNLSTFCSIIVIERKKTKKGNTMKFIITIQTQFKENYGAHDWDGQGECPQYWKYKGGSEYIAGVVTLADATKGTAFLKGIVKEQSARVSHSDDYSEEYMIDWDIETEDEFNARHDAVQAEWDEMGMGNHYRRPVTVEAHVERFSNVA